MTFALAAAGTGGHVFPALAVAEALVAAGVPRDEVVFFGGDRIERDLVPAARFTLIELEIRGLRRSPSLDNLAVPFLVRRAARVAAEEIERRSIHSIAVFGGYITGPVVLAARRTRTPYVVHEQNAVPGLANKLASRRAGRVFTAFASAADALRNAEVVGNPLRGELDGYDRTEARSDALARYGLAGERPVLGVVGGSQGALALNELVAAMAPALDADIVQLAGRMHEDRFRQLAAGHPGWNVVAFEDRMDLFYAAADVVLARAGAMTVSELAATGTPSVLVPLPAGRGYQARNADDLAAAGGTVVVEQEHGAEIVAAVRRLLADTQERDRMARAAASVGHPEAAQTIAAAMMEARVA